MIVIIPKKKKVLFSYYPVIDIGLQIIYILFEHLHIYSLFMYVMGFLDFFGRVNKPYLPIAAGDLSVQSAWFLVLFFAAAGLLIVGLNFGPFISSLYCLGLFLGTIYSVPPFRLKRFAVAAFLIVATVSCFFLSCLCFSFLFGTYDEMH